MNENEQSQGSSDDRKLERIRLSQYLRVFDRDSGELLGQLENITMEGMMLSSVAPLEKDKVYLMWMDLPAEIDGCLQIIFDAKCVWSSEYINADLYNSGFCLTKIDDQNIALIKKITEEYRADGE